MPTPILTDLQRIELAFPIAARLHGLHHVADANPRVGRVRRLLARTALDGVAEEHGCRLRWLLDRVLEVVG